MKNCILKMKACFFWLSTSFHQKIDVRWEIFALSRAKWNSTILFNQSARKSPLIFFKKWRTFKCEKYQKAILGSSSPDSVAILEKKFGKSFSWFYVGFLKKPAKKSGISIKTG